MYQSRLGPKLLAIVESARSQDPDEQLSLYDELALLRDCAGNYVEMYSQAREKGDTNAITTAGELMSQQFVRVEKLVATASRLQAQQRDRFSVHDLKYIIDKLLDKLFTVCQTESEAQVALKFRDIVDAELVVPSGYIEGVDFSPADDVQAFDESIPNAPSPDTEAA